MKGGTSIPQRGEALVAVAAVLGLLLLAAFVVVGLVGAFFYGFAWGSGNG